MTATEVVREIENYYGPYTNPTVKALVASRLSGHSDRERRAIFDQLVDTYENRFGTQPDVAAINKADDAIERDAPDNGVHVDIHGNRKLYRDGYCVGHYDGSRLIPWQQHPERKELST